MSEIMSLIDTNTGGIAVMSIAILLDIITGIVKAIMEHDLKSSKFKQGLLKKSYDYILVIIAFCLDYLMKVDYVAQTSLFCLIAMEFYSCVENLREYIPIPNALEKVLNMLQDKGNQEGSDTE